MYLNWKKSDWNRARGGMGETPFRKLSFVTLLELLINILNKVRQQKFIFCRFMELEEGWSNKLRKYLQEHDKSNYLFEFGSTKSQR